MVGRGGLVGGGVCWVDVFCGWRWLRRRVGRGGLWVEVVGRWRFVAALRWIEAVGG